MWELWVYKAHPEHVLNSFHTWAHDDAASKSCQLTLHALSSSQAQYK